LKHTEFDCCPRENSSAAAYQDLGRSIFRSNDCRPALMERLHSTIRASTHFFRRSRNEPVASRNAWDFLCFIPPFPFPSTFSQWLHTHTTPSKCSHQVEMQDAFRQEFSPDTTHFLIGCRLEESLWTLHDDIGGDDHTWC
jgi:hypothetical protein